MAFRVECYGFEAYYTIALTPVAGLTLDETPLG